MRLVKPNWVTHDGSPIYSVDIHPDGKRFATGGQGGDSGRVVIWNLEPVLNEAAENNSNIPKMLCQLNNHFACVNCVRWNSSGLLASAGDDKLIMIWRLAAGVGINTLFGAKAGVETWRCISTLRSHEGDILDLAWAPHNPWLASASVDNTVIVWDTSKSTIVAVLKGHSGLVKGVAWDPVGKYLATQSDDKTLKVWRTNDWGEATTITEPFEECGSTTHVLRLSWSPDGQYLVSAHAMNGGGPTAQIIEREGWKRDKDYVGHRKAVTCVRFNSNILQKNTKEEKAIQFCCVAIGSRDRSISIWSTPLKRPLVVINELFLSSVLDLSWSSCGMRLCACSMDGTVVFIEFTSEELGIPLDSIQLMKTKERLYGKIAQGGCTIIESPELLKLQFSAPIPSLTPEHSEKKKEPSPPKIVTNCVQNTTMCNSTSQSSIKAPLNKQIETRTTDGKRRITPMFIPPPPETIDLVGGGSKPVPTLASTSDSSFSSSLQSKSTIVIEKRNEVVQPNINSSTNSMNIPEASTSQGGGLLGLASLKRKDPKSSSTTDNNATSPSKKAKSIPVERNISNAVLFPSLKPKSPMSLHTGRYTVTINSEQNLSHMQVYEGTDVEPLWDQFLGYGVTAIASTPSVIAVSLEDGTVHTFYTSKGARATPPLVPPSPISRLVAAGSMIMIISCYGDVRVWDIVQNACRLVCSTSAAHLVTPGISILRCSLYNGMPHIAFTNARAYVYHKEMGTWLLIGDSVDPVWRWSAISAMATSVLGVNKQKANGPVAMLQEGLHLVAGMVMPPLKNPNSIPCIASYLEQQVLISRVLGSSQEYVQWLLSFVTFLVAHDGLESRLRIILDDLLGPSHSGARHSNWDPNILGIKKHTILEDVLKILSSNMRWQRLYIEYNDQLEELKKL